MLRMTPRRTLLAAIATIAALTLPAVVPHAAAQRPQRPRTGFAFYDVDRLYDTLPSPFYDDADFTPQGRLKWDTERYRSKIRRTAAVIDSMALPLVALYGVENERVVRDLAAACRGDYSYLHRTLNTLDGLDFALLYYGDRFFPHRTEPGDRTLYVEGTLGRDTVGLLLVRDRRMLPWIIGELHEERPQVRLLVAGSVTPRDAARWGLHDATARAEEAGRGTVRSRSCITLSTVSPPARAWSFSTRRWRATASNTAVTSCGATKSRPARYAAARVMLVSARVARGLNPTARRGSLRLAWASATM